MKINTRIFGTIEIEDTKIIHFPGGIVGFPDLQDFALIHDEEQGNNAGIHWMQSVQETQFAMPVIDPLKVKPDYNPEIEDELLKPLGDLVPDETLVLSTISIPTDLTKMTVNLKAPFVINAQSRTACQVIAEGYEVKYPVYEILRSAQKAGE